MYRKFYYCWQWELESSPQALWPYVADTDRFNRDTRLPAVEKASGDSAIEKQDASGINARRLLRFRNPLISVVWEEEPFEWAYPHRFGVVRNYLKGPLARLRVLVNLKPLPEGGTHLTYETWATPRNLLGLLAIPVAIGLVSARRFRAVFAQYDRLALSAELPLHTGKASRLTPGGEARLENICRQLVQRGIGQELVGRLAELVTAGDDLTLARLRPYAFADYWQTSRRHTLELFLQATRLGMLDLQWEVLCPHCRGSEQRHHSLSSIDSRVYCSSCQIDFDVNFEHSVELTFSPNPAIRAVRRDEYCIGGPEVTPHIIVQQLLPPRSSRTVSPLLEVGRYRLRTWLLPGHQPLQVTAAGRSQATVQVSDGGWPPHEPQLAPTPMLHLQNDTAKEQLLVLERLAWNDQATTAAEVTALQSFRDLFANEALRPGEQISVGGLTILFTDLCDSTRMYRDIGDATAFGLVMDHFDVLRDAIAAEEGAVVKTIGDAVMAVFRRPVSGLRAILKAQDVLATPPPGQRPLLLKAALHSGPAIAVTLNERLDYFGTTVNVAARLEKFSAGGNVVVSKAVYDDPEVQAFLQEPANGLQLELFESFIKGFDEECFTLWHINKGAK